MGEDDRDTGLVGAIDEELEIVLVDAVLHEILNCHGGLISFRIYSAYFAISTLHQSTHLTFLYSPR